MKSITKLILFNLLLTAPAIQAMGVLRSRITTLARTATMTQVMKPRLQVPSYTFKPMLSTQFMGYNGGYSGGYKGGKHGHNFAYTHAAMPILSAALAYSVYERLKSYAGYMPAVTVENIEKYPNYKEQFVAYVVEHIDQVKPELVRALLKQHPDAAVTIHEAAMAHMNDEDCETVTWSTPEETAANGGVPCSTTTSGPAPERYDHFINIVKETFLYPQVIEAWLDADPYERFVQTNIRQGWVRHLILTRVAMEPESPMVPALCSVIEENGQLLDKLLQTKKFGMHRQALLCVVYDAAQASSQQLLEEKMQQLIAKRHPGVTFLPNGLQFNEETFELINKGDYPFWAYGLHRALPENRTQTEAHMFDNQEAQEWWQIMPLKVRSLFYAVHEKEKQERAQGNYVFYHGQPWTHHFYTDLYKQLWNIAKNDSVGDDFTFVRFNEQKEAADLHTDSLWMNHALFGNAHNRGSSTANYFYANSSASDRGNGLLESIFSQINMPQYLDKYKNEIAALEELHNKANDGSQTKVGHSLHYTDINGNEIVKYEGCGNLLLVSVPADKMHYVQAVHGGTGLHRPIPTTDGRELQTAKEVVDTLVTKPDVLVGLVPENPTFARSDLIEYTMPITTEYALDPKNGPRFYQFNAADPEKLKEYTAARDALFAKIKQDFEAGQTASK